MRAEREGEGGRAAEKWHEMGTTNDSVAFFFSSSCRCDGQDGLLFRYCSSRLHR